MILLFDKEAAVTDLSTIRKDKNMTQETVASMAGISRTAYTNIENGMRNPSVPVAKSIAKVLDFDWTKFFEE